MTARGIMTWSARCAHCGTDLTKVAHTMSYFNTDTICLPCQQDERDAPGYQAAVLAESDAVRRGQFDFAGVGLSAADRAFLDARIAARRQMSGVGKTDG